MEDAFLIVGLGNPGAEYVGTRHNAGFLLVERLAVRWKCNWANEKKFRARMACGRFDGRRVYLCEPRTFMNASGEAVGAAMEFYRLPADRLIVASDDAD
ncbi:MAG: aminoacyl-tRNA hydrolase, partial [Limisphaerales bacterium]